MSISFVAVCVKDPVPSKIKTFFFFLDAFSHLYKRVCPSVRPSVGPSVGPSVRPSHTSWISEKWADFEQNSVRNMRLCHLKDNSETSTLADRQNASVVWTLFNLLNLLTDKHIIVYWLVCTLTALPTNVLAYWYTFMMNFLHTAKKRCLWLVWTYCFHMYRVFLLMPFVSFLLRILFLILLPLVSTDALPLPLLCFL